MVKLSLFADHGAFAFIGNSRYCRGSTSNTNGASQRFDRQFWDAVFGEWITRIGMANADSKEDNVGLILMRNPFGRTFVKIYYSTSPPIADLVRENDGLRLIVREGLVKTSVYVARRFVD